ncbi:alpha/beta hydrolase [Clostridiaceae bacterium M8S5]|nr:alpha/beta hydrolase [Clostridiaceae bacterium M8S5]
MKKTINESILNYEITGNKDGPWLILLHGLSGSTKSWKAQIDSFNKHFSVLNLDLNGHGKSPSLDTKLYSGSLMANQVRMIMDKLNIDKAHFLGISLGAIVEQYFAALFPERVISLIYASPLTKSNLFTTIYNNFVDKIFLKISSKDTYCRLISKLMLPGKKHKKSREFFIRESKKMDDLEFAKWWKIVLQGNHYDYIPHSEIPALILAGRKDFCFYNDAVKLCEKYENCKFITFKDSGHIFIFDKAQEFNDIVIKYINEIDNIKPSITQINIV